MANDRRPPQPPQKPTQTQAIAKNPVIEKLMSAKANLITRLPHGMEKERFFLGIMTAIQRSQAVAPQGKSLADCNPASVLLAAYDAAEVGCSLSPSLQLGWLIPYAGEAQFQPSYRFFIQKAYESGEVKTFLAEVVYKGDKFERQFAPKKNLFHAPADDPAVRTRDNAIGAYAFIEFTDGTIDWEFLSREQIDRHRNHSKQQNSLMWTTFWEEGWRKSPVRVLAKRLPLRNRNLEGLVEMVNRDTENDLVIPPDSIDIGPLNPPRRASEAPQEQTEPKQEQEQPEQGAEPQPETRESAGQPTQAKASTAKAPEQPGMFQGEPEGDPLISTKQAEEFWEKGFDLGWKKAEMIEFLKKEYSIGALKELKVSQYKQALELLSQGR